MFGTLSWLSWSSARELCFRRKSRLVKARSRLVWEEEDGVDASWLLFCWRGGVAATAANVGRRMFVGNWGCCLIVFVVRW